MVIKIGVYQQIDIVSLNVFHSNIHYQIEYSISISSVKAKGLHVLWHEITFTVRRNQTIECKDFKVKKKKKTVNRGFPLK